MVRYRIAVVPGDGIGIETIAEAVEVLDAASRIHGGFALDYSSYPWGCDYYLKHGLMMPTDGLRILADYEDRKSVV